MSQNNLEHDFKELILESVDFPYSNKTHAKYKICLV